MKFNTYIPLTLSFTSYSFFKESQVSLVFFSVMVLVKMKDEIVVNKFALACLGFSLLPLLMIFYLCKCLIVW